jgi:hypothetical protein
LTNGGRFNALLRRRPCSTSAESSLSLLIASQPFVKLRLRGKDAARFAKNVFNLLASLKAGPQMVREGGKLETVVSAW